MKYWINTVSRSHVREGVKGGFTQADFELIAKTMNADISNPAIYRGT